MTHFAQNIRFKLRYKLREFKFLVSNLPFYLSLKLKERKLSSLIPKSSEFTISEISQYYRNWSTEINENRDDRIRSIAHYCGYAAESINNYLRGYSDVCSQLDIADNMSHLLSTAPTLPHNTVLYRVINLQTIETIISEMMATGSYTDKGFLSTSISLDGIANISDDTIFKKMCLNYTFLKVFLLYI